VLSSARMTDPRLPIAIKKLPGGYRLQFNDGKSSMMVYGTNADTALATGSLSTEEARAFAEEVALILASAWGNRQAPG
jgi:hypothetical protein